MSKIKNPAKLTIFESLAGSERRKRVVRVIADSLTIGSHPNADIELQQVSENFMVEIKFQDEQWWVVNPLRSNQIRVNGQPIDLESAIHHGDQILLANHQIHFVVDNQVHRKKLNEYEFGPHPGTDEKLWDYLTNENDFDEIMINGHHQIYVDFKGSLLLSPWTFSSNSFLEKKALSEHKKNHSSKSSSSESDGHWLSWQLNRRLRFQAALEPLAEVPHICIRKARHHIFNLDELQKTGFGTEEEIAFLKQTIQARQNIVVAGATSSGKTVLLRSLVEQIPHNQRVIILEEEAETDWPHPHRISLEAGRGRLHEAVRGCLRMRPDRLIISEIRSIEAFDFLQAINTGHEGSMTTIHANSPREALVRLENLILAAGVELQSEGVKAQLAQAIDVIVHLARQPDGQRKITSVQRLTGIQNGVFLLGNPIGQETRGIKSVEVG